MTELKREDVIEERKQIVNSGVLVSDIRNKARAQLARKIADKILYHLDEKDAMAVITMALDLKNWSEEVLGEKDE